MSLLNYNRYKICISPKSAKRQGLRTGDVVRRQYFDGKNVVYSLMAVLETGIDRITTLEGEEQESPYFIGALLDGDVPQNGQILDFVRVTNLFDEDRSGAMYLTASDSQSPYMDVIDGMAPCVIPGVTTAAGIRSRPEEDFPENTCHTRTVAAGCSASSVTESRYKVNADWSKRLAKDWRTRKGFSFLIRYALPGIFRHFPSL